MAYTRGASTKPTILPVEQVRRRNAELRRELAALTAEHSHLEANLQAMRQDVTTARRKLSRQVRELAAIRAQAEQLAAVKVRVSGGEPVFGGPEGLRAAAAEIRAREEGEVTRQPSGASCGTRRKYGAGCRCGKCRGWRERKSAREVVLKAQRLERRIAEALQEAA